MDYVPGEGTSGLFGGTSNWRGPIWFPVNYLLIEALERYHHFYGDDLKVECPTGSGPAQGLRKEETMRTLPLWSLALSCGLVLGAAALARAEEPPEPDHGGARTAFVTILAGRLQPEVQRIHAGEAFGWLNYSDKIARVSFAKDVAKHLTCKSQGSFRVTGDRLESADIQAQQFATLCNLAVGEYPYRVVLRSGIGGGGGDVGTTREGRLVVE